MRAFVLGDRVGDGDLKDLRDPHLQDGRCGDTVVSARPLVRLLGAVLAVLIIASMTVGVLRVRQAQLEQQRLVWIVCTEMMDDEYWSECKAWAREGLRLGVDLEAVVEDVRHDWAPDSMTTTGRVTTN